MHTLKEKFLRLVLLGLVLSIAAMVAPGSAWAANTSGTVGADFAGAGNWYRADNQTVGSDVINTEVLPQTITHRAVQLDSDNNPHIVWSNEGGDIFYSHWTGTTWTGLENPNSDGDINTFEADNLSSNLGVSVEPSLVLFDDAPYVAWSDTTSSVSDIYFTYWDGSNWTGLDTAGTDNVSGSGPASTSPSIAIDSNGMPGIAWAENSGSSAEISFAQWDGSAWAGLGGASPDNVSANATASVLPSLAFDGTDTPHVAWQDGPSSAADILYSRWNGSIWRGFAAASPDNISSNTSASLQPSIAVTSAGLPTVAWSDNVLGNAEILLIRWTGSTWRGYANVTADDVSGTGVASITPSLILKSDANPAIAWAEEISSTLSEIRYTNWNDTTYTGPSEDDLDGNPVSFESVVVANAGVDPMVGLALDSFDDPAVSWNDFVASTDISRVLFSHWISDSLLESISGGATLERISGADRIGTSIAVSKRFYPVSGSADNVILARSDLPVDALVTAPFAALKHAPILLNPTAGLDVSVSAEIARVLKPGGTVYLMGQTMALSTQVETDLTNAGFTEQARIGGARRQETSVEVAEAVDDAQGATSVRAFVANGFTAVDALVAGAPAVIPDTDGLRTPIVLASVDDLPTAVADYLQNTTTIDSIRIFGGTAVIGDAIAGQIASLRSGISLSRTAGANRYATARLVGEEFFPTPVVAFLTVGRVANGIPPDAVVIAPHAGPLNGAILLVQNTDLTSDARQYLDDHKDTLNAIKVIGGTAAVSDAVAQEALQRIQ